MIAGAGNTGGVNPKPTETQGTSSSGGEAANPLDPGFNWMNATLQDVQIAFILEYGPEQGQKMFNQFQMMIFQTCLSQMREMEPKQQDDQNQ